MQSRRASWARVWVFIAVTYAWSAVFMAMAIRNGDITIASALGGMWSPFVGVVVMRVVFPDGGRRGNLRGLGWTWGGRSEGTKWQIASWFLPALYVGLAHGAVWAFGLAGFVDEPIGDLAVMVLKRMLMGLSFGAALAFGEEVGWQGFLVPQVYRLAGFTRASLFRGVVWSVWHFPLIIGGVYGTTVTPLWYRLICFTVTMTAVSFAFTWFRMKSGSLWTGVWMHAAHNIFFQSIYPRLTAEGDRTAWFVNEFGAFSAAAAVLVALFYWNRRPRLEAPPPGSASGVGASVS